MKIIYESKAVAQFLTETQDDVNLLQSLLKGVSSRVDFLVVGDTLTITTSTNIKLKDLIKKVKYGENYRSFIINKRLNRLLNKELKTNNLVKKKFKI